MSHKNKNGITRRTFIAGSMAALAAPAILTNGRAYADNPVIKIGYVGPRTGPLAAFTAADDFILLGIQKAFDAGITNNGKTYRVEIIPKDSASNADRAAEAAAELILIEKVDIIVAASTPDTTNPVADMAEANGVPCITTDCPWQSYFFGRNGVPEQGFNSTYHFFWGLEDVVGSFIDLWEQSGVNKVIGGLFPADATGFAWAHPKQGFPGALKENNFQLVNPGLFPPETDDFSSQIEMFKETGCEIITGNMIPPSFIKFWSQAEKMNFHPKVVTIGKALLFPSVIDALGERGVGLSSEIWWSPSHPFFSSLTGDSTSSLAKGYTTATGRPWTQPIGFKHALFEVVADVIRRAPDLNDRSAIISSIASTNLLTIVGQVDWSKGPVKNVTKTPLVAGQWQKTDKGLDLVITANKYAPGIAKTGAIQLLS